MTCLSFQDERAGEESRRMDCCRRLSDAGSFKRQLSFVCLGRGPVLGFVDAVR